MDAKVDVTGVILETDRLILRPWRPDDLEDFYEYAKVEDVGQMAGWKPHASMEESREILCRFIGEKRTFALELKGENKVVGSLGLEELTLSIGEEYDARTGREIGYALNKDYWGRGLMPEAVKRVIAYCFEDEKYDYLTCRHSVTNLQSKRVIEKVGFCFVTETPRVMLNGEKSTSLYYVLDNPELTRLKGLEG